jgi:hypothetical protein
VKDEEKGETIKTMVGDIFNCMQECEDYIEMFELDNSLLFYHKGRDKRFAANSGTQLSLMILSSSIQSTILEVSLVVTSVMLFLTLSLDTVVSIDL